MTCKQTHPLDSPCALQALEYYVRKAIVVLRGENGYLELPRYETNFITFVD